MSESGNKSPVRPRGRVREGMAPSARSRESGNPVASQNALRTGSPKFTNEVQHLLRRVLRWDASTDSCHWRTAARLPDFKPKGDRPGKSRQLWIARHRAFLVK